MTTYDLSVPSGRIGPFVLEAMLFRGDRTVVCRAYDTEKHKLVALKILTADYQGSDEGQRFFREQEILEKLSSRANKQESDPIAQLHAASQPGSERPFYVATNFVEGETLRSYLQNQGDQKQIDSVAVRSIGRQLLQAVALHKMLNVVHRDIKPENIMVQKSVDGSWKTTLIDYSIAVTYANENSVVQSDGSGTEGYMSPEQVQGQPLNYLSDLYTVGIVLWELLTGARLFGQVGRELSTADGLAEIGVTLPTKIHNQLDGALSKWVTEILYNCLATDRVQREQVLDLIVHFDNDAEDKQMIYYGARSSAALQQHTATNKEGDWVAGDQRPIWPELAKEPTWESDLRITIVREGQRPTYRHIFPNEYRLEFGRQKDYFLADERISAHHFTVERRDDGLEVTRFSKTNGVWLNGNRLERLVPTVWLPGSVLRVGPYFMRWGQVFSANAGAEGFAVSGRLGDGQGTNGQTEGEWNSANRLSKPTASAIVTSDPLPALPSAFVEQMQSSPLTSALTGGALAAGQGVQLAWRPSAAKLALRHGQAAELTFHLTNTSDDTDTFSFQIEGGKIPHEWIELPSSIQLTKGQTYDGMIRITPTAGLFAQFDAGYSQPLRFSVRSNVKQNSVVYVTSIPLEIFPYQGDIVAKIQPELVYGKRFRRSAQFNVEVHNKGNALANYEIRGGTQVDPVVVEPEVRRFSLKRGEQQEVVFAVTPQRVPLIGQNVTRSFQIKVVDLSRPDQPYILGGRIEFRPRFRLFWLAVIPIIIAGFCIAGSYFLQTLSTQEAARQQQVAQNERQELDATRDAELIANLEAADANLAKIIASDNENKGELIQQAEETKESLQILSTQEAQAQETQVAEQTKVQATGIAGQATAQFSADATAEANEPVILPAVSLQGDSSLSQTEGDTLTLVFTLASTATVNSTLAYKIFSPDINGVRQGSDYSTANEGEMTWLEGEDTAELTIPLVDDDRYEPTETFTIGFSDAVGIASAGLSPISVTVKDNDNRPTARFVPLDDEGKNKVTEPAGADDIKLFEIGVLLENKADETITLVCLPSAADTSATPNVDYELPETPSQVTWQPGETGQKNCSVKILGDLLYEANDEQFILQLFPAVSSSVLIGQPTTTVIIEESSSDPPLIKWAFSLTEDNSTTPLTEVTEGDANKNIFVTVSDLEQASSVPIHLIFDVDNGSASEGKDFKVVERLQVTWPAGSKTPQVTGALKIEILEDNIFEAAETILVVAELQNDSGDVTLSVENNSLIIKNKGIIPTASDIFRLTANNPPTLISVAEQANLSIGTLSPPTSAEGEEIIAFAFEVTDPEHCLISATGNASISPTGEASTLAITFLPWAKDNPRPTVELFIHGQKNQIIEENSKSNCQITIFNNSTANGYAGLTFGPTLTVAVSDQTPISEKDYFFTLNPQTLEEDSGVSNVQIGLETVIVENPSGNSINTSLNFTATVRNGPCIMDSDPDAVNFPNSFEVKAEIDNIYNPEPRTCLVDATVKERSFETGIEEFVSVAKLLEFRIVDNNPPKISLPSFPLCSIAIEPTMDGTVTQPIILTLTGDYEPQLLTISTVVHTPPNTITIGTTPPYIFTPDGSRDVSMNFTFSSVLVESVGDRAVYKLTIPPTAHSTFAGCFNDPFDPTASTNNKTAYITVTVTNN